MQDFRLRPPAAVDHAVDDAAVLGEQLGDDRGIGPRGRENQLAGSDRRAVRRDDDLVRQPLASAVDEFGRH